LAIGTSRATDITTLTASSAAAAAPAPAPAPVAGFDALAAALGDAGDGTATEVFWGALHGMSLLERAGRMRREHRPNRIAELAARFAT
jgi:hypothetical protein